MRRVFVHKIDSVTSGAVAFAVKPKHAFRLMWIEHKINTAPSTSQAMTHTKDTGDGDTYDNVLYTRDLSVGSVTDIHQLYGEGFEFEKDDEIDIAYTNTDNRTITTTVCYELI